MRLSIYDHFIVGVVRPPREGGPKAGPIAYIEEGDRCVPLFDLLIPNNLDDAGIARYVGDKFCAFARGGGPRRGGATKLRNNGRALQKAHAAQSSEPD